MSLSLCPRYPHHSSDAAIILDFDRDQIYGSQTGDVACLVLNQVYARQGPYWRKEYPDRDPVLLQLHGTFGAGQVATNASPGPLLVAPTELPLAVHAKQDSPGSYLGQLWFQFPRRFAQYLEEMRAATTPKADLQIMFRLWGTVAVPSDDGAIREFIPIAADQNTTVRMARSDWVDRILPALGYPLLWSYDLPLLQPDALAKEVRSAVLAVNDAWSLFSRESYREALKRCRDARDALLGKETKATWCKDNLTPVLGEDKTAMVDQTLRALNPLWQEASHGLEVDRQAASCVLGLLTTVLNYVGQKLK